MNHTVDLQVFWCQCNVFDDVETTLTRSIWMLLYGELDNDADNGIQTFEHPKCSKYSSVCTGPSIFYVKQEQFLFRDLPVLGNTSIMKLFTFLNQIGRANIEPTASHVGIPLNMWRLWLECSDWFTCDLNPTRRVSRRRFDDGASSLKMALKPRSHLAEYVSDWLWLRKHFWSRTIWNRSEWWNYIVWLFIRMIKNVFSMIWRYITTVPETFTEI